MDRHTHSPASAVAPVSTLQLAAVRAIGVFIALAVVPPARAQHVIVDRAEAVRRATTMGLPIEGTVATPDGQMTYSLQRMVNGIPLYYHTTNANAAISLSTDKCRPGAIGGLSLTGSGVTLGIWDAGAVLRTHVEFGGRATQRDSASQTHAHATHVAGTMIATGTSAAARGMSPEARLDCYDWNSDTSEMNAAAQLGLRVSNHSYGLITGWQQISFVPTGGDGDIDPIPIVNWTWFGDTRVSAVEDYNFGYYSFEARQWDQIAVNNPRYLFVKSAGNDRNQGPPAGTAHSVYDFAEGRYVLSTDTRSLDGNGGYDCISHSGTGKNGLTVGAVNDVSGGYQRPQLVTMSSFSCWGPTDDGRIKPDVVGNGVQLYSSTNLGNSAYATFSGTSMSSPNVSGSIGLLIQHFRDTHPGEPDMLSSTLKGLLIGTADECGGAAGPDYQFGWGLVNTLKAADVITADQSIPLAISEHTLQQGEELEWFVISDASQPFLRATICWTDPVPTFETPYALDPRDKILVNDLDLRIDEGDEVHMPWVLDVLNPSRAATRGDNNTDNVEQIAIDNHASLAYRLRVSHKGELVGGSQVFSLIISGASSVGSEPEEERPMIAEAVPADGEAIGGLAEVKVTFTEPVSGVAAAALTIDGVPAQSVSGIGSGPYTFTGNWSPPDGMLQVELTSGDIKDIFENDLVGSTWSYLKRDCNGNRILDDTDIASHTSEDCNLNLIPDECDPAALKIGNYVTRTINFGDVVPLHAGEMISGGVLPLSYEWTLRGSADEQQSFDESPQFRPSRPGTYVARLVATDAMNCRAIGFMTIEVGAEGFQPDTDPAVGNPSNMAFCPMSLGFALVTLVVTFAGRRLLTGSRRRRHP